MRITTSIYRNVFAAALTAAISAIAIPASASFAGTMQGYACQSFQPLNTPASSGLVRGAAGLVNTDTSNAAGNQKTVVCPVQRVNADSTTGLSAFKVYFADNSPNHNFICSISSEDYAGNVIQSSTKSGGNSGATMIDFGGALTTGATGFQLWCSLGASSVLHSYNWVEI